MSDRHERNFLRWLADHERGTWREDLRSRYAPWFDGMPWGFEVGDGWRALIEQLTAEVSDIVGGPDVDPKPRVVQVKEKFGELRYYIRAVPASHADAIYEAVMRAEARSRRTCEACGAAGELRQTAGGYLYTSCRAHIQ
ncbi:MAG TPA: hypothetical protein VIS03_14490 [Kiloniellaceae bacterium]